MNNAKGISKLLREIGSIFKEIRLRDGRALKDVLVGKSIGDFLMVMTRTSTDEDTIELTLNMVHHDQIVFLKQNLSRKDAMELMVGPGAAEAEEEEVSASDL